MPGRTIPIHSLTPAPEEPIVVMPMPRELSSFEMPRRPESGPGSDLAGAAALLAAFVADVDRWLAAGGLPPARELCGLPPATLRVLNETLGEGEVSAIVDAGHELHIQETVFPGIWREQHFDADGVLQHDVLLAAPIPPVVAAAARQRGTDRLRPLELPAGTMNVPALVNELQAAMDRCGPATSAHVINLTLLPLSPVDTGHLDRVLEGGSVVILSRGFGNCRISSTAARHVWRVQYFNNMQTLILNTIEVVEMPQAAVAAPADLVETRARLGELVQWLGDSTPA